MRFSLPTLVLLAAVSSALANPVRRQTNCTPKDNDGGALTASTSDGVDFSCSYEKAGKCDYLVQDGTLSSGASNCPTQFAQDASGGGITNSSPAASTPKATTAPANQPSASPTASSGTSPQTSAAASPPTAGGANQSSSVAAAPPVGSGTTTSTGQKSSSAPASSATSSTKSNAGVRVGGPVGMVGLLMVAVGGFMAL